MQLAVLDLAGTTMADDGLVLAAFRAGLRAARVRVDGPCYPALDRQARATMDRPALTVFGELLDGDMYRARRAHTAFAEYLAAAADDGRVRPVDGAPEALDALRDAGMRVALTCGFDPVLRDRLVEALDFTSRADVMLSPADVDGRGLPEPDLLHAAAKRTGAEPSRAAVAGDATAGIDAAVRAGAGLAIGVRGGAHGEPRLRAAGADAVIDSVADLPALLGLPS
ncbi:Haloacid dehalogenase domain protein hydrolase [Pseudonocardia sp. Ae168_Ps1]|uniref:HAD family hydrolase n=1 Tax=unclassified Pseudonocardia TaxID=2619320 RepID=UPI00076134DB|nr:MULTISPECIES: HAD family hydrolase [unclassified Pseudonocardia]OLL71042.1 Haloacid dehalogenase domain protein hydrolase [Pseudonocardia sp. Ae168_Ps1]OLL77408.1 Haloacid dehalogenase domain protein hydrolase [Pseudonocardia sp. Ae150A_Ps1]OLL88480.1 Haloacid dehalogenase domain protein hydrolase [Pseudonocardia sp. Ae263_Ps1]OLL91497.1 Haloacid dehalogenase domain protein hydrolase [Pseudonocardia sp. Ae356_Ps1]OLM18002.1 Haloacid dehalogenase domain protein hydrolase [Pseudonocardia sp. 